MGKVALYPFANLSMDWLQKVLMLEHKLEKESWEGEETDEDGEPRLTSADYVRSSLAA